MDVFYQLDREIRWLFFGILIMLAIFSVIAWPVRRRVQSEEGRDTFRFLTERLISWWGMCAIFLFSLSVGYQISVVLFAIISFLSMRGFMSATPSSASERHLILWTSGAIVLFQYWLVWDQWYGLFSVFIPVYAFILIPVRMVVSGIDGRFLERNARIQFGLMVSVFFISHIPMLFSLQIPGFLGQNAKLLFFMVVVVQGSDVLQHVFGKLFGRHKIAPITSPEQTWEGFILGVLAAAGLATGLYWITPFQPFQAFLMGLFISVMGFCGSLVMAAMRRDRGIETLGRMMDGIDSICFAAPIYFHITRWAFTEPLPELPSWLTW